MKKRLDEIVSEKLNITKTKAQGIILAGNVFFNGKKLDKPGIKLDENVNLIIKQPKIYVSRGAYKILHALEKFNIDVSNKIVCDIGASTGGFTQVCLEKGAKLVYAIDVGTNQLDYKLRIDNRVISMENTDFRSINLFDLWPQICLIDVSFISLSKILLHIKNIFNYEIEIIALFKPQFEADKKLIDKYKGVIDDEDVSFDILQKFLLSDILKYFNLIDYDKSPIKGGDGNTEYLLYLKNKVN